MKKWLVVATLLTAGLVLTACGTKEKEGQDESWGKVEEAGKLTVSIIMITINWLVMMLI
jgi:predicted small secreted protein